MLTLHGVEASYGEAAVLHDLSFEVGDGESVVLLGRNGMGKTSTMRTIMGWAAPQVIDGAIRFGDLDVRGMASHRIAAAGLGYVPQGRMVFPSLSVQENLAVADRSERRPGTGWTAQRVYELFPQLADRKNQQAATLSGGEQQMLAIGRALMTNPRLLLLDEPSEGLAPSIVRQVGQTITELQREGIAILVAEQDIRLALGLADRVVILERGHVVAQGTPAEIDGDEDLKRRHLGIDTKAPVASIGALSGDATAAPGAPPLDVQLNDRATPSRLPRRARPAEVTPLTGLLRGRPWHHRLYSNGWSDTSAGTKDIIEPATGAALGEIAVAGPDEVARAAESATGAQREWAETSFNERVGILRTALGLLTKHADELVTWLVREGGATRSKARGEVDLAEGQLGEAAAVASQPGGELLPADTPDELSMARRVPLGVVGVISPFTYPLAIAARAVAPGLVQGNAVLLKPDVRTAVSGGIVLARLFEEAGLPNGLLHVLPGGAETGRALVTDANVDAISFAGSVQAAREVAELGGRHLKNVSLQLGGNNAHVVLDDADLEFAASAGAWASFGHQGQGCVAAGRHLVHEQIADAYVDLLAKRAARLSIGNPHHGDVDLGPMIDEEQARRVAELVATSVAAGARVRAGGVRHRTFLPPTVLVAVTPDMPVFAGEIMGPVAPVTTFATDTEAVELANQTDLPLSAAIQTGSLSRGLAIARRLRSEMVHINGRNVDDHAHLGGMVGSGRQTRYGGRWNLEAFTQWQWVTARDKAPGRQV